MNPLTGLELIMWALFPHVYKIRIFAYRVTVRLYDKTEGFFKKKEDKKTFCLLWIPISNFSFLLQKFYYII